MEAGSFLLIILSHRWQTAKRLGHKRHSEYGGGDPTCGIARRSGHRPPRRLVQSPFPDSFKERQYFSGKIGRELTLLDLGAMHREADR